MEMETEPGTRSTKIPKDVCLEDLLNIRVHDLKHSFGHRLRATGVSFKDSKDLPGQTSGRITMHYSAVELQNLIDAAKREYEQGSRKSPVLLLLRSARHFRRYRNNLI